jgi:hypothetical protein
MAARSEKYPATRKFQAAGFQKRAGQPSYLRLTVEVPPHPVSRTVAPLSPLPGYHDHDTLPF